MTNIEMEKELLANGFTEKEVNRLKKILTHEYAKGENLQSMILDLKQRFVYVFISILVVLLIYPFAVSDPHSVELVAYLFTVALTIFIVNLVAPIKLSYKSYRFLKKQDKGE